MAAEVEIDVGVLKSEIKNSCTQPEEGQRAGVNVPR
jgi:hypothetical protein